MKKEWENAIESGKMDQVPILLDSGASIDALDRYGQTAIMKAAHGGHTEVVRLLIERGADLNHTAKFGLSALMLAVISDCPEIVQLLILGGANATLRGSSRSAPIYDKTALELAEQMQRTRCAEILRKAR